MGLYWTVYNAYGIKVSDPEDAGIDPYDLDATWNDLMGSDCPFTITTMGTANDDPQYIFGFKIECISINQHDNEDEVFTLPPVDEEQTHRVLQAAIDKLGLTPVNEGSAWHLGMEFA